MFFGNSPFIEVYLNFIVSDNEMNNECLWI